MSNVLRESLGQLCLIAATGLYLVHLIPQIIHTFRKNYKSDLSFSFMWIMLIGFVFDYIFALVQNMPVLYQLVSTLGLAQMLLWVMLSVNHEQRIEMMVLVTIVIISAVHYVSTAYLLYLESMADGVYAISQICFLSCWLMQCARSLQAQSAQSLSCIMIWLSLCAVYLDYGAAWLLGWRTSYLVFGLIAIFYHSIVQGYLLVIKRKETRYTL